MKLSSEHQKLVSLAKEVSQPFGKRIVRHDIEATFPEENFRDLKDAGLLTLTVPKEQGGHGFWQNDSYAPYYAVLETIAANCSSTAQLLQVHSHAVGMIAGLGNAEQRQRYMASVVDEGALFASCGSEASVRTDRPDGFDSILSPQDDGSSRLNGTKGFASLAPAATTLLIWALAPGKKTMAEGLLLVAVPRAREGVGLIDNWDTFGMRPTVSWALKLNNVAVAANEVIGQPGDWVRKDPRTYTLGYASNHLGQAVSVFDFVLNYVKKFGDLHKSQLVQLYLAEAECKIHATRALIQSAAHLWESNDYDAAELQSMRAMHLSKDAAISIATRAFDVCGARATFKTFELERLYRDIRTFTLHFREEVILQLIASAMLGQPFHSKQRYDRGCA